MKKLSIVYYTANREKFEDKVIENILRVKGDVPVISVSQKPLDFGKNIVVGDVGHTYLNAFRQCLIGCEKAKTPYVAMAESDVLYPAGYFDFKPNDANAIWDYDNVWLMWNRENRTRFYKHGTTHGSVIYGRRLAIKILKRALKECPKWSRDRVRFTLYQPEYKWRTFTGAPMVNIKTREGVSFGSVLTPGVRPQASLPGWGTVEDVKKNYGIV